MFLLAEFYQYYIHVLCIIFLVSWMMSWMMSVTDNFHVTEKSMPVNPSNVLKIIEYRQDSYIVYLKRMLNFTFLVFSSFLHFFYKLELFSLELKILKF